MKAKSLIDAVEGVTAKWAKQRKQEEKDASARLRRGAVMMRRRRFSMKDAAAQVLPAAWAKASGDGKYPASARQIFYAARGPLQELTGKEPAYGYFAQGLLPDYIEEHGLYWDVTYDARGAFREPHSVQSVALGTLPVRQYLGEVAAAAEDPVAAKPEISIGTRFPTNGPRHRFGAILFLEKEGFGPLLAAARIAERFDLAIMSTKGMSVTAARRLIEKLCGPNKIPLLIAHDFDVSGFTIAGTLKESTRRFSFSHDFEVIDIGLRLGDVEGLEPEEVYLKDGADAVRRTLVRYGATAAEIGFLLGGRRVEVNAMTSPQFVEFLETKLVEHGVEKIVPDDATLWLAAQRAAHIARVQEAIDALEKEEEEVEVPEDLREQVRLALAADRESTWDAVLVDIMRKAKA